MDNKTFDSDQNKTIKTKKEKNVLKIIRDVGFVAVSIIGIIKLFKKERK